VPLVCRLKKELNTKVMNMYEKAEEEYKELTKKKVQIEMDKAKLKAVISELEEKKNEALEKTYVKVNKDFGSIFSTLLKGAEARLEPPEGNDHPPRSDLSMCIPVSRGRCHVNASQARPCCRVSR
jgi:chromosome segregation ATPase